MSKYYREEDLEKALIGFIRETGIDEKPYDYAVNVLDKLPTIEVSEDCISREGVIKALRLEFPCVPLFKELREQWLLKTEGYHKAEKLIEHAPSVVPSRAEGEWIKDEYDIPHCSECNCINNTIYRNFCPNCGAKMKGVEE